MKKRTFIVVLVSCCLLLQLSGCRKAAETAPSESDIEETEAVQTESEVKESETELSDVGESKVKSVKKYVAGAFDSWYEYQYDEDDNLILTTNCDADHNIIRLNENQYDKNGDLVMSASYDADHNLIMVTVRDNDKENNIVKSTSFNTSGDFISCTETEY